jgi:hypothetical protein
MAHPYTFYSQSPTKIKVHWHELILPYQHCIPSTYHMVWHAVIKAARGRQEGQSEEKNFFLVSFFLF